MYVSNIAVEGRNDGYVILVTRQGKRPHKIYKSTKGEPLIEGTIRAIKGAQGETIILRTDNGRVQDLVLGVEAPATTKEAELASLLKNTKMKIIVRNNLNPLRKIANAEFQKRKTKVNPEIPRPVETVKEALPVEEKPEYEGIQGFTPTGGNVVDIDEL